MKTLRIYYKISSTQDPPGVILHNAAHNDRKGEKNSAARVNLIMLFSEINNKHALSEMPLFFYTFMLLYSIFHHCFVVVYGFHNSRLPADVNSAVFMTAQ